jgi:site-specific DNA-methyltransferase (adenine-specific)
MSKLQIEYRETASLIPYARNSRTHSDQQVAQIAASIKEFGFTNPILLGDDGVLIAGHGRLQAAQKLSMEQVPTITLVGLTEAQRRALVIADNRIAENSGWDLDMLRVELGDLQVAEFDMSLLGFGADELQNLLAPTGIEGNTDPDEAPAVPDQPVSVLGDVWVLGKHRVMCGDSLSVDAVTTLMGGALADVLITDPPYNVAYEGKTKDALKIQNDSMDDESFRQFLRDAFVAADTVMKPGAVFYIWHADSEGYNFRGACRDAGWKVRQCLVWEKDSMVMGRQDYHWKHEPCLYGWKDGAGHLWAADRKQTTLLKFDRPKRNDVHPTMKPVALIEYQLLNNTKGGDVVLDLFGGSGTTLIAAEKNGRYARLMELDPKYVDVIVTRWQAFSGLHAHLESDGRTFTEVMGERAPGKLVGNEVGNVDKADAKKAKKAKPAKVSSAE